MEGATIISVALNRADLRFPFDEDFAQRLAGQRILSLSRRAKYLLCELETDDILAMHLGMSGSFRIERPHAEADRPGLFHHPRAEGACTIMWRSISGGRTAPRPASSTTIRAASASCAF